MSDLSDKQIRARCARKPKTSKDLNVPIERLRRLEQRGDLFRVGTKNYGRGRPAVLFAAADVSVIA